VVCDGGEREITGWKARVADLVLVAWATAQQHGAMMAGINESTGSDSGSDHGKRVWASSSFYFFLSSDPSSLFVFSIFFSSGLLLPLPSVFSSSSFFLLLRRPCDLG
jgi:hypothetical protein